MTNTFIAAYVSPTTKPAPSTLAWSLGKLNVRCTWCGARWDTLERMVVPSNAVP